MPTPEEYRDHLTNYIKDHTQLNRLLRFVKENSPDEIDMYLYMALGFLNSIPPPIGLYTMETFPVPALLIHQATIECLISNSIVMARNDLTYNNGGVTVKISDGDRYLKMLQILYRMTDMEISAYKNNKIAINISGAWGGVASPYAYLHTGARTLKPNTIM